MLTTISGIDHIGVDPEDVWDAFAQYSRLGFTVSTPGRFEGVPVESCQITFPDKFLSLSTTYDAVDSPETEWVMRTKPAGISELMLGTVDIRKVKRELFEKQPELLNACAEAEVKRRLYLDGKIQHQVFRIIVLEPGSVDGIGTIGFCENATRELVWRPELVCHPNGAMDIHTVTFSHKTPQLLSSKYVQLFGESNVRFLNEGIEITVLDSIIRFATEEFLNQLLCDLKAPLMFRASDLKVIDFLVEDLAGTKDYLEFMGIDHFQSQADRIYLSPDNACGFVIGFTASS